MKQSEIRQLMKQEFQNALDQKILRYDQNLNARYFERALNAANQLSKPSFWPKLIQYRLAHLLMRNANDVGSLNRAKELLSGEEVTEFVHLDFVRRILRIACLHRLSLLTDVDEQSKIQTTLKSLLFSMEDGTLNSKSNSVEQYPLQSYHFNLIEMAMHFTGTEIANDDLLSEGSKVMHNQRGQKSWKITLPDGTPEGLFYDRDMAFDEVAQLMAENPGASLLILGEKPESSLSFRGCEATGLKWDILEFLAKIIRKNGRAKSSDFNLSPSSIGRYKNKLNSVLDCTIISYVANSHWYELSQSEKIFLLELV